MSLLSCLKGIDSTSTVDQCTQLRSPDRNEEQFQWHVTLVAKEELCWDERSQKESLSTSE